MNMYNRGDFVQIQENPICTKVERCIGSVPAVGSTYDVLVKMEIREHNTNTPKTTCSIMRRSSYAHIITVYKLQR